jgi:FSR family fosmidomycin resistance protein-like MFS transporter
MQYPALERVSEGLESAEAEGARATPFQTSSVLTIIAGHAVHDMFTAFLAPLLPLFIAGFSLTVTQAGALSLFLLLPATIQPFIGRIADRRSLRPLVIVAPLVAGLSMSCLGLAPSYAALAFLLAVAGLNTAGLHAVAPAMTGRLSGEHLGRGMGLWMMAGELGRTIGPLVIVSAVGLFTLHGTFWLIPIGVAASALLFARLRAISDDPPALPDEDIAWGRVLRQMAPVMIPLTGIMLVRGLMQAAITSYLPTFLTLEGESLWFAGASLSLLEAAGVAGAMLGGVMSDSLGRRRVLLASALAAPVFLVLFLRTSGWLRFPLLVLIGLSLLSIAPVIMAVVQENFPEYRAMANGMYMMLSFSSASVGVLIVGMMSDALGMRPAFFVSGLMMLLAVPLIARLPRRGGTAPLPA